MTDDRLNAAATQALRAIRTARELVFPFLSREHIVALRAAFHRLQRAAGTPRKEHFGLHAIRNIAATVLAATSFQAAQLPLRQPSLANTVDNFFNGDRGAALDAMPQPFATP